jgi:hypothetical protein
MGPGLISGVPDGLLLGDVDGLWAEGAVGSTVDDDSVLADPMGFVAFEQPARPNTKAMAATLLVAADRRREPNVCRASLSQRR